MGRKPVVNPRRKAYSGITWSFGCWRSLFFWGGDHFEWEGEKLPLFHLALAKGEANRGPTPVGLAGLARATAHRLRRVHERVIF